MDNLPAESLFRQWMSALVVETNAILSGASAAISVECADESTELFKRALADVSRRMPQLIPAVLEAREARHHLFVATRRRGDVGAAGQRLLDALRRLAPQLPALDHVDRAESQESPPRHIGAQILEKLQDDPLSVDWSAQKWADHLRCSKSTIVESPSWTTIMRARALHRAGNKHRSDRPTD
jgi:hypothetical protein